MSELRPCPGCERHVRGDEGACPFCGHAVATHGDAPRRRAGLGRAALFALGVATGAAVLAPGCGDDDSPEPDSSIMPPYGAPPADGLPL